MTRTLHKILHIDDDTVMRMMVTKSIQRSHPDINIISCAHAQEFMDSLESLKPDLLIIDVMMPAVDGPTLLGRIRHANIQTPAIFMTGQETIDFDNRSSLEPIIGVINKPFSPTKLGDDLLELWKNFKAN